MRCYRFIGVLFVAMVACASNAVGQAATFPEKPPPGQFYVDEARVLTDADAQAVDAVAASLLQDEQFPILVVTIPSLAVYQAADLTVDSYAAALFDAWGIGSQNRNYGMLLLVSVGDHKARIELGRSWGGQHDDKVQHVMDTQIIPAFKRGDFSSGILGGVQGLDMIARWHAPKPSPQPHPPQVRRRDWQDDLVITAVVVLFGLCLAGVAVSLMRTERYGLGWFLLGLAGAVLCLIIFREFTFLLPGFGDSDSSSGGGSFDGGSSGGGGASGSW